LAAEEPRDRGARSKRRRVACRFSKPELSNRVARLEARRSRGLDARVGSDIRGQRQRVDAYRRRDGMSDRRGLWFVKPRCVAPVVRFTVRGTRGRTYDKRLRREGVYRPSRDRRRDRGCRASPVRSERRAIGARTTMTTITSARAKTLASAFAGKRIMVLGDMMLDQFIWGRVKRISPEAPVPVVEVDRETSAIGGAGNVVSNLVALGASAFPLGIIGDDSDAARLQSKFEQLGVDTSGLIVDPSRPTTIKTRIIAHNQQVVRTDRESRLPISSAIEQRVLDRFQAAIRSLDAVVVSDYNKGLLTSSLLKAALTAARDAGVSTCVDPKTRTFSAYQPVTVITPNNQEAAEAAAIEIVDESSLIEAGRKLLASIDCRAVLVTRGEEGMSLFTDGGEVTHIPTMAREVYDVTGAGDTVVATMALALASGATFPEAAITANHAAGVVVAKVGTATVSRAELLDSFQI